jgi:RimJ/RimL family protein N-acetyltransferase
MADDRDALVAAWTDPEIRRWTAVPDDADQACASRWIAGGDQRRDDGLALDLVATATDDGRILGEVGLWAFDRRRRAARIGWWTAAPERGRGVAATMVRMLTDWAHDGPLGLHAVVAEVDRANLASVAVVRAVGFDLLGRDPEHVGPEAAPAPALLVFASLRTASGRGAPARV